MSPQQSLSQHRRMLSHRVAVFTRVGGANRMNRLSLLLALVVVLMLAAIAGCRKKAEEPVAMDPVAMAPTDAQPAAPAEPAAAPAADPQRAQPAAGQQAPPPPQPAQTAAAPPQAAPQATQAAKTSGGADWPNFRGPNLDGIAPDTGINKDWKSRPPRELWRVNMTDDGYAVPSVADGKVFIIDHQGSEDIVRAIDLNSGQDVWTFRYADTNQANYGFARAAPTYAKGKLYTISRLGMLHCLDAKTGAKLWALDIVNEYGGQRPKWDYSGSVLADGDRLVLCPGGKTGVVALDRESGKTLWTGGLPGAPGYAMAVPAKIGGKPQYVCFSAYGLYAVDKSSGKTLWQFPWPTNADVNAATPLVIGDNVFITSGYRVGCGMVKVGGSAPSLAWRNTELQSHFNSPVLYKGHIYGIGDPGVLVCIDPNTGQALWKQRGYEKGGLTVVDGVLIAVKGGNGEVTMVSAVPDGFHELGSVRPLGGQSWTPPVVARGKLIIRNTKALACLDLM